MSKRLTIPPSEFSHSCFMNITDSLSQLIRVIDIQDRYCKLWLKIENEPSVVEKFDRRMVEAEAMAILKKEPLTSRIPPSTHAGSNFPTHLRVPDAVPYASSSQYQDIPPEILNPQPFGPAVFNSREQPPTPQTTASPVSFSERLPFRPTLNPNKRVRPNSFDSNDSTAGSFSSGFTNFSWPVLRVRQQLRDSGFFSSLSSSSDRNSLVSRMSRLSIEVKLCSTDHALLAEGSFCSVCRYPETNPKPILYLAPEHAITQSAEEVDADEMDNGNLRCNANARK
jgi:hypothetical protein